MEQWYAVKQFLAHSTDLSMDALHVIGGLIAVIACAFLVRKPISHFLPWALVLLLAVLNEAGDLWVDQWPTPELQYGEAAKDVLITMVVPTMLLLSARYAPWLCGAERLEGGGESVVEQRLGPDLPKSTGNGR